MFNQVTLLKQFRAKVILEVRRAFLDPYFKGILFTAICFLIMNEWAGDSVNGIEILPVTYRVLGSLTGSFDLFMLILIIFYSGQIIWKERELNADSIMDAHPVPNWIPMLSKLIALILIPGMMLFVLMLVGLGIQTWKGFYAVSYTHLTLPTKRIV